MVRKFIWSINYEIYLPLKFEKNKASNHKDILKILKRSESLKELNNSKKNFRTGILLKETFLISLILYFF